jgi:hypothetical protein
MVPYLPNPTAFLQAELTGTPSELSQLAGPLQVQQRDSLAVVRSPITKGMWKQPHHFPVVSGLVEIPGIYAIRAKENLSGRVTIGRRFRIVRPFPLGH